MTSAVRTPDDAAGLGTVLGVWAHPDDEAYLSAGLMALARRAGNRVVCVTATRGEHGTSDPAAWPPDRLARTRELEVRASLAVLGVDEHRFLGFEDGTLAGVPPADGAALVLALIDEVDPDTIVTFGPDGMTGHPDHRAVAGWVTAAWQAAPRARLLRATTTARFADEFADVHAELGVFDPGLPLRTPDDDVAVTVHLDAALQDVKLAALRAQATQVGPVLAAMGERRYAAWWREECFTALRPASTADLQDLTTSSPRSRRRARSESSVAAGTTRGTSKENTGMGAERSHRSYRSRHDVAVVGARAGGAATALLLARMGHDVVVLDRDELPSDTVSTHSIARSGVVQLHRWGLLDDVLAGGAPPIRQVTFHGVQDEPIVRQVKDRAGVDVLVAPRRHALDTIVAGAAAEAGATLRLGHTVTGLRQEAGGRVAGLDARGPDGEPVEVDARLVIGADGLRSPVARAVGAPVVEVRPEGSAATYAYFGGVPWTGIEFFLADRALAGIFPTHGGEACIWVCAPPADTLAARREAGSLAGALDLLVARAAPELAERLRSAERASRTIGATRLPNQVRQAHGPGWALVGDALYHRDPITGHGISDAYRDAELLATAVDSALRCEQPFPVALDGYRGQAADARRRIFDVTCALGQFPPRDRFVELQRHLSDAIEAEATALAARPPVHGPRLAAA